METDPTPSRPNPRGLREGFPQAKASRGSRSRGPAEGRQLSAALSRDGAEDRLLRRGFGAPWTATPPGCAGATHKGRTPGDTA